jgi:hypothetical protein
MNSSRQRCLLVLVLLGGLHGILPPALSSSTIYVRYVRRLRNSERRISFEKAIGIPCRQRAASTNPYELQQSTNPFGDSLACGLKRNHHYFRYDVPDNEEAFWLRVLRTNPSVAEVRSLTEEQNFFWALRVMEQTANMSSAMTVIAPLERPPARKRQKSKAEGLTVGSAKKNDVAIEDREQEAKPVTNFGQSLFVQSDGSTCSLLSAALHDKSAPSTDINNLLLLFLSRTFECRGGRFRLLASDADFVRFQVDHLRGEVITGRSFWERIEATAVFFPVKQGFKVHMFLDAQYAAGLGSEPPPESAFSSVETEFYKQEGDYVEALLTAAKSFLDKRSTEP